MFFTRIIKLFNKKNLLFFFIILTITFQGISQIEGFEESDYLYFQKLYNFEFKTADSIISSTDSILEPNHINFLRSHYMRWFHIPIHQQNDHILSTYSQYLEGSFPIGKSKAGRVSLYSLNSALLKAEYNYNQGNFYKALQNGMFIYDFIKEYLEEEPESIEVKFLAALYHYYYHYYNTKNPVFSTFMTFLKDGDKDTGLEWLEKVASKESSVKVEAHIYLSHIFLRIENNPQKALPFVEFLYNKYPDNLKFYELYIETHIALNMYPANMLQIIERLIDSEKIYFQKYGHCYKALLLSICSDTDKQKKIRELKKSLTYVQSNNGGNHLSSLLYNQLHKMTSDNNYLKEKERLKAYEYILTGYSEDGI